MTFHLPSYVMGLVTASTVFLAADLAHAGGLNDVPAYTSPCDAPLLSRRAYAASVFGPYEEAFYAFYRTRRLELCGDPMTATGVWVPPSHEPTMYRPIVHDRLPPWWTIPQPCYTCGNGGTDTPPVIVPPEEPAPVPLGPAGVFSLMGIAALFLARAMNSVKRGDPDVVPDSCGWA